MTPRIAFDDRNAGSSGPRPTHRAGLFDAFVLDCFAGGGGASLGIERGLRRRVNLSINHDPEAVAMHKANHPLSDHHCQDVHDADPETIVAQYGVRDFALAWFSPDCTFHSKARGGKPIRKKESKRRDLAWVVIKWAKLAAGTRPRVIMLENVEEFADWGPLDDEGKPCKRRKGQTFRRWRKQLENLGYAVEFRMLRACDYGSPTIRKRLFLIARCDGKPIVWPEVTHGQETSDDDRGVRGRRGRERDGEISRGAGCGEHVARGLSGREDSAGHRGGDRAGEGSIGVGNSGHDRRLPDRLIPFRTAAECIDWSIPCPSIFLTKAEALEHCRQTGQRLIRPLAEATLRRIANGLKRYVIDAAEPFIVRVGHYSNRTGEGSRFRGQGLTKPMSTITNTHDRGIVVPCVTPISDYGKDGNGSARARDANVPLSTITAWPRGGKHALVAAFLNKHRGSSIGADVELPLPTITSGGNAGGRPAGAAHALGVTAAYLTHSYTSNTHGGRGEPGEPIKTILAGGNHAGLVAAHLMTNTTGHTGQDARDPMRTLTTGDHQYQVAAFLQTYYGNGVNAQHPQTPHATLRCKQSAAVVTVDIEGEPFIVADVGMRMLSPRELFRCQGFPDSYVIDPVVNGKALSKAAQVRMCGNSVCPQVAAALVAANFAEELEAEQTVRHRPRAGGRVQTQTVEVA